MPEVAQDRQTTEDAARPLKCVGVEHPPATSTPAGRQDRNVVLEGVAVFKPLIESLALVGALAFLAGWSYLSSYLSSFGLNPLELDVGSALASVFALHVLYRSVWPIALLAAILSAFAVFRVIFPLRKGPSPVLVATSIAIVSVVAFVIAGIGLGRSNARADLFETSSRLPAVGFATDLTGDYPACVAEGLMECRLLVHWKSTYYFFEPIRGARLPGAVYDIQLYALPDSHVKFVRYNRGEND